MDWKKEKENIDRMINVDNLSYEEIGRMYGCTGTNIKKVSKKLGIPLPQRRIINDSETFNKGNGKKYICCNCGKEFNGWRNEGQEKIYCSLKCFGEYVRKKNLEMWENGEKDGTSCYTCSSAIRRYLLSKYHNSCQICGWSERNQFTNRIPLQIHHIDGNSCNNREDNLQVLCPNCHSLTENYGSRNKNATNGRSKYYGKAKG